MKLTSHISLSAQKTISRGCWLTPGVNDTCGFDPVKNEGYCFCHTDLCNEAGSNRVFSALLTLLPALGYFLLKWASFISGPNRKWTTRASRRKSNVFKRIWIQELQNESVHQKKKLKVESESSTVQLHLQQVAMQARLIEKGNLLRKCFIFAPTPSISSNSLIF